MSIKVVAWVLESVRLPGDPIAKLVLIGLADHANSDGTASWPTQKVLAEYADVTVRTVRTKLGVLEDAGLIKPGDERLVDHLRADRRPQVWDLNIREEAPSGRKLVSSREGSTGGTSVPLVEESRAETGRSHGRKLLSHKPSLEPSYTEDSLRSSSAQLTARDLVAEWIDHCNGNRPPGRVVGHVAKEIDIMLREGIPYADIRSGLQYWQSKGLHPSALASAVHEVRTANSGGLKSRRQLETDAQFDRALTRARERDQNRPKEIE